MAESNFVMSGDDDGDAAGAHLDAAVVAAYVDRVAEPEERARIEAHLAECAICREELVAVTRLARQASVSQFRGRRLGLVAAAVAAALVIAVWPQRSTAPTDVHREAAVTTTVAPMTISPAGDVDSVPAFVWTSVPRADGYWVRVFSADGSVRWEHQTRDTSVVAPLVARPAAGEAYYWRVEARTGFDRVASSELTEFTLRPPPR